MKVLVTGAGGMLGTDIMHAFKEHNTLGLTKPELDITKIDQVTKTIGQYKPDLVINCAAYTKVDDCEINKDLAFKVNALGPRNLAIACQSQAAAIVHISTDYVFDGTANRPYTEFDSTKPLGVYGQSKFAGEQLIKSLMTRHFIIRTSWLYGANGPNFVETMLRLAKEYSEIKVVNDQQGSPTYTKDLAQAVVELIKTPAYGLYHLTNSGNCTWYQFAKEIFRIEGIDIKVNPCTTEAFPRPAPRPKYSVMENYFWKLHGRPPMRDYKEALKEYLDSRG
ncbi:dTDP-4-dehydrorhamnose reductase [Metallumcola ferriviriculae]|uniref:dTDP-4-dehydrorhamnose reductase n=1 Tax=Metallumcola ferriviriculae TaxID=3039180 RepID=A0AAU0UL49_9FIRM|nr:dTDP-4-dehydrorhamnose reductase [Desulfitibacteraceae bacterium MK1]